MSNEDKINVSLPLAVEAKQHINRLLSAASDHSNESVMVAVLLALPDWMDHALERGVTPDVFHGEMNRRVFAVMVKLAREANQQQRPVDFSLTAFAPYLEDADCRHVADLLLLSRSDNFNATASAPAAYNRLMDCARRRTAIRQTHELQKSLIDAEHDTTQAICSATDELASLTYTSRSNQAVTMLGNIQLPERDPGGLRFTHLPYVCHLLDGFRPGTLSVVAARTGVGKSALLQSMAIDAAIHQDVPALFLDTEMTPEQFKMRVLAAMTGYSVPQIRARADNPAVAEAVARADAVLAKKPLAYVSIAGKSFESAISEIRKFERWYTGHRPLVLFDYIKLPTLAGDVRETQVLGQITNALKEEAVRGGFAIVAGAQANRAGLKMTHDDYVREGEAIIYGSDKIAHLCDCLMILRNLSDDELLRVRARFNEQNDDHEPANRLPFNTALYGSKVREGSAFPQGIPLYHRRGFYQFREVAVKLDNGTPVFDGGRPAISEEFSFFRSPEFRRQGKKGSGFGAKLPQQAIIGTSIS